jgi:O-antigen chain-terminating methyltransferase
MQADFYKAFEDKFRGSSDAVKNRLGVYRPILDALRAEEKNDQRCVDLGCGRGEWLEILKEKGFQAAGFDLDSEMIRHCINRRLQVEQIDVVAGLEKLPENSVCLITGFHIAEHLPFEVLAKLMQEAMRVLAPDGILILETPNPENILVGSQYFYLDPTHVRPLPMQLLGFLAEYTGFERVNIMRLGTIEPAQGKSLLTVFTDVSQDYAVVSQKRPTSEKAAVFEPIFRQNSGMSINRVAELYDLNLNAKLQAVQQQAERIQQQAERAEQKLQEYIQSRSIRYQFRKQMLSLRQQGIRERFKRIIRKISKKPLKIGLHLILKNTRVRNLVLTMLPIQWANRIRNNILGEFTDNDGQMNALSEYAVAIAEDLHKLRRP